MPVLLLLEDRDNVPDTTVCIIRLDNSTIQIVLGARAEKVAEGIREELQRG